GRPAQAAVVAGADEQGVEGQGPGAAPVVAARLAHADDRPGTAGQPDREEPRRPGRLARALAVTLAGQAERLDPLGPAAGRSGEHVVAPVPEREAAVNGLLDDDHALGLVTPTTAPAAPGRGSRRRRPARSGPPSPGGRCRRASSWRACRRRGR